MKELLIKLNLKAKKVVELSNGIKCYHYANGNIKTNIR